VAQSSSLSAVLPKILSCPKPLLQKSEAVVTSLKVLSQHLPDGTDKTIKSYYQYSPSPVQESNSGTLNVEQEGFLWWHIITTLSFLVHLN
jgi:hypothetical protein